MGWLTKALSPENPSDPIWPSVFSAGDGMGGGNDAGIQLTELNSRSAAGVLACTRVISEAAAAYPKEIYQKLPGGGKRLATEHPLYSIIHDAPNPQMTNFIFWVGIISQTCIWGNGYAQIQRDGSNRARALWPLPASKTRPHMDNGELVYITTAGVATGERVIPAKDIIHIPFLSYDGIQGYSPIQLRRQGLALSMAAERFGAMLFGRGARPSGILETVDSMKPEQRQKLKQSMQESMAGENAMGMALLPPGVTFKALTIDPHDAQFLETRKYQVEDIARDYRVPAHMIGLLERATHSNAEQLGYDFSTYTMLAWVNMIEQELNKKLFANQQFYCKLNMDVFLRGDFETRMAGYQVMRNAGVLNANDICRMEDWPEISQEQGGDIRIVPMNMVSLEQLRKQEDEPDDPEADAPDLSGGENDPAPSDAGKEQRVRFSLSFGRLFQDATGRTIARAKKDEATVKRVWLPTLNALAESMMALGASTELKAETVAFVAEYAGGIAQRCQAWNNAGLKQTAAAEFDRAYTALIGKV